LFRNMAINVLSKAKPLGQVIQSSHGAEINHDGLFGFGNGFGPWGRLYDSFDDVFRSPKVLLPNNFGLAVDPLALPRVIIGLATDHLLSNAGHDAGHTISHSSCQELCDFGGRALLIMASLPDSMEELRREWL